MAPEMAAAYVAGLIPSTLVAGAHLLLFRQKVRTPTWSQIQKNLNKVGMYWSESAAAVRTLADGAPETDITAYMRGLRLLGLACIVLSWAGMFFHLIILLSLRYLAVPRIETAVLESSLAQRDLTSAEVMDALAEVQAHVLNAKIPGFGN